MHFPKLNECARDELEEPFTLSEILEAIKSFSNGKASGPDGFGVEFYKVNANTIAPLLLRMVNHSIELYVICFLCWIGLALVRITNES